MLVLSTVPHNLQTHKHSYILKVEKQLGWWMLFGKKESTSSFQTLDLWLYFPILSKHSKVRLQTIINKTPYLFPQC